MYPCPHCLHGKVLENYKERACLNCGYQESQPSQLPLIAGNMHSKEWQDYDGIKREWRRARVLVDHRTREFQGIDNEIIARVRYEKTRVFADA